MQRIGVNGAPVRHFFLSHDFVVFQTKMRKKRKKEAEERERAITRLIGFAQWGIAGFLVPGSALGLLYLSWANYG